MRFLVSVLFLFSNLALAQTTEESEVSLLSTPDGWRKEVITFPLPFAPDLKYEGIEDIRFSPGWGDVESKELWTYAFVWSLDEDPELTNDKIRDDFKVYFDGLMKAVASGKNLPTENINKTQATFKQKLNGFEGIVMIYDAFFTQDQITLNVDVSVSYCEKTFRHFVFFKLSPKDFEHKVWDAFDQVVLTTCP